MKLVRRLSPAIALLLCYLAFSHFDFMQAMRQDEMHKLSTLNIMDPGFASEQRGLLQQIEAKQNTLEFMVWPRERERLRAELAELLHQSQNNEPARAAGWFALLTLQESDSRPDSGEIWVLARALQFYVWSPKQHPLLGHYCVQYFAWLEEPLRGQCQHLVREFDPVRQVRHVAQRLRVDPAMLQVVLEDSSQ